MLRWTVHLKDGPLGPCHTATVAVGDNVYSFMGHTYLVPGVHGQIEVYIFNTVALRWKELPHVPAGREDPSEVPSMNYGYTAVLIEDIIYIWGGGNQEGLCNITYAFDVHTLRWFKPKVSGTDPSC